MPSDQEKFDVWLRERWYEKDALMEQYLTTGRFPPSENNKKGYIETEVRTKYPWEFIQVYVVLGIVAMVWNVINKMWHQLVSSVFG